MQISSHWRFGFEIEVVLGTLDDSRFLELESDPMDTASPIYCRAVADPSFETAVDSAHHLDGLASIVFDLVGRADCSVCGDAKE
jgi:hypothetical protein